MKKPEISLYHNDNDNDNYNDNANDNADYNDNDHKKNINHPTDSNAGDE